MLVEFQYTDATGELCACEAEMDRMPVADEYLNVLTNAALEPYWEEEAARDRAKKEYAEKIAAQANRARPKTPQRDPWAALEAAATIQQQERTR